MPVTVEETYLDPASGKKKTRSFVVDTDEGPRADTSVEALAKLRPVFAAGGTVTAGNSSQTSDGAAFVLVMSERMVKELNLEPIARMVTYATEGVDPRIMGMGPVKAVPKALKQAGMKLDDIDLIELNEAFASQSIAVMRELDMDPEKAQRERRRHRAGPPAGLLRRQAQHSAIRRAARPRQEVRHGDGLRGRRPGRSRHLRAAEVMHASSRHAERSEASHERSNSITVDV